MQQQLSDWERGSLIPPRRLGAVLSEARTLSGRTLEEIASVSDERFSLSTLASIERGTRHISDDDARVLADLYQIESTSLVPARSKLVIDLDEGLLIVDHRRARLGSATPTRDEVLSRYLAMVYSMRQMEPGSPLTLRVEDLDILGRALHVGSRALESDLDALMRNPGDLIGWKARILSRRVLIPAAGVLVAAIAGGTLLLAPGQSSVPAHSGGSGRTPAALVATAATSVGVSTDIGSAVQQERNADGTPGPVTVRLGESADASQSTTSPAILIAPNSESR